MPEGLLCEVACVGYRASMNLYLWEVQCAIYLFLRNRKHIWISKPTRLLTLLLLFFHKKTSVLRQSVRVCFVAHLDVVGVSFATKLTHHTRIVIYLSFIWAFIILRRSDFCRCFSDWFSRGGLLGRLFLGWDTLLTLRNSFTPHCIHFISKNNTKSGYFRFHGNWIHLTIINWHGWAYNT